VVAAIGTGAGETISYVLLNSAAQEARPPSALNSCRHVIPGTPPPSPLPSRLSGKP
jgi:hypothetical protein